MPSTLNAPGIYIEELPSGVHPIVGVSTSDTAFVDWFQRGPVDVPTRVTSFDEFTRIFGPVHPLSPGSYAVYSYFLHGGAVAWIVRATLVGQESASFEQKSASKVAFTFQARSAGTGGNNLGFTLVKVDDASFNLHVKEEVTVNGKKVVLASEVHRNLSAVATHPRYFVPYVNTASSLITIEPGEAEAASNIPAPKAPKVSGDPMLEPDPANFIALAGGKDADPTTASAKLGEGMVKAMQQLTKIEPAVFNMLCMPALPTSDLQAAIDFCTDRYAFLIVDPPDSATSAATAGALPGTTVPPSPNAALYWPRIVIADPAADGRPREIAPSGAVAGIIARTDATRGVWKAPAGIEASLGGAQLALAVTEADSQVLNPLGVNVLRTMPVIGNVVWGARTLFGADIRASEWKYIPVRRTALFIEQSLNAGLKWVVFEPNDEPLWAQIRLNVGSFMQDLFRKGAFQGTTPRDAYFVRCDKNTTTQSDIDKGVVNILVGFAPLKPAEFVVIQIQQMAGQATA